MDIGLNAMNCDEMDFKSTKDTPPPFASPEAMFAYAGEAGLEAWQRYGDDDDMMPATFTCRAGHKMFLIEGRWGNWKEKQTFRSLAHAFMHAYEIEYYTFMTEIWIRQAGAGSTLENPNYKNPMEVKDDGFMVVLARRGEKPLMRSWVRVRGEDGKWVISEAETPTEIVENPDGFGSLLEGKPEGVLIRVGKDKAGEPDISLPQKDGAERFKAGLDRIVSVLTGKE